MIFIGTIVKRMQKKKIFGLKSTKLYQPKNNPDYLLPLMTMVIIQLKKRNSRLYMTN